MRNCHEKTKIISEDFSIYVSCDAVCYSSGSWAALSIGTANDSKYEQRVREWSSDRKQYQYGSIDKISNLKSSPCFSGLQYNHSSWLFFVIFQSLDEPDSADFKDDRTDGKPG